MTDQDKHETRRREKDDMGRFVKRVVATVMIVFATIIVLFIVLTLANLLLVIFAGALFAILLRALTDFVKAKTRMPDGLSLLTVLFVLAGFLTGALWLVMPSMVEQTRTMMQDIPAAIEDLRDEIARTDLGGQVLRSVEDEEAIPTEPEAMLDRFSGMLPQIFSTTIGIIAGFIIFLFVGIYGAATPELYRSWLIKLVPTERRARAEEVVDSVTVALRHWMVGNLVLMVLIGTSVGLGLWALGVPHPLALGVLAGIFEFVPTIGPIIASIPAILLGWFESPATALYVILLYTAIQQVESYVFAPLIFKRAVKLPPILTISSVIAMGILVGPLGLLLATPLMTLVLVLVQKLYIEDALNDHGESPGEVASRLREGGDAGKAAGV